MKILVTGASGFVGKALIDELKHRAISCVGVGRQFIRSNADEFFTIADPSLPDVWQKPLAGCDAVIHLAARVHIMNEQAADPLAEFRKVNVDATVNLAKQAAQAGVKRFVYVSSIGVNGLLTISPFTETDEPNPHNAYAISKREAEVALQAISKKTGMEVVIVRPPLVYGLGAKGNFLKMINVLNKGVPLPLSCVSNRRSLIYVGNLVDALILCAIHTSAAGKMYLVSDGEDISTADLLRQLGKALGRPARLFCCPQILLKIAGWLLGKSRQVERLLGSLQIDSSRIRRELGWVPPFSLTEGLKVSVANLDKNNEE